MPSRRPELTPALRRLAASTVFCFAAATTGCFYVYGCSQRRLAS